MLSFGVLCYIAMHYVLFPIFQKLLSLFLCYSLLPPLHLGVYSYFPPLNFYFNSSLGKIRINECIKLTFFLPQDQEVNI